MTTTARELARSRNFITVQDVELIQKLVEALSHHKFLTVVDLGAGSGTTALAVLEARLPGSVLVTTVDIDENNLAWAEKLISNVGRLGDWRGYVSDAADFAEEYYGEATLVLIDTSHEYEATVRELAAWRHKVCLGGFIWCHDYVGYDGVKRAVDEAIKRKELFPYLTGGLGWSGKAL